MARLQSCRVCFVELERIELANGRAMLFCATCDRLGDERHIAAGAPGEPAGMGRKPLKLVVNQPRPAAMKKFSHSGKKSLTA